MNERSEPLPGRPGRPSGGGSVQPAAVDPLADRTHRLLRQLPGRRAPATLAPRVLAELARRAQLIWYRRPWTDWPEALRWLSTLVLAATVAGTLRLLESGWTEAKSSPALAGVQDVPVYWNAAETCSRSLLSLVQLVPANWWLMTAAALGMVTLGTLGLGTAAWRLARSSNH